MTPKERAQDIVERFFSTPEGFAPDDKKALIEAIEKGMNEVLSEGLSELDSELEFYRGRENLSRASIGRILGLNDAINIFSRLKSDNAARKTVTQEQGCEK